MTITKQQREKLEELSLPIKAWIASNCYEYSDVIISTYRVTIMSPQKEHVSPFSDTE